jgi:hypothetical protein
MTYIIAISVAVAAGVVIEWGQRHCEAWAYLRDKDL